MMSEQAPISPESIMSTEVSSLEVETRLSEREAIFAAFADTPMVYTVNGEPRTAMGSYAALDLCPFLQNEAIPTALLALRFQEAADRYIALEAERQVTSPVEEESEEQHPIVASQDTEQDKVTSPSEEKTLSKQAGVDDNPAPVVAKVDTPAAAALAVDNPKPSLKPEVKMNQEEKPKPVKAVSSSATSEATPVSGSNELVVEKENTVVSVQPVMAERQVLEVKPQAEQIIVPHAATETSGVTEELKKNTVEQAPIVEMAPDETVEPIDEVKDIVERERFIEPLEKFTEPVLAVEETSIEIAEIKNDEFEIEDLSFDESFETTTDTMKLDSIDEPTYEQSLFVEALSNEQETTQQFDIDTFETGEELDVAVQKELEPVEAALQSLIEETKEPLDIEPQTDEAMTRGHEHYLTLLSYAEEFENGESMPQPELVMCSLAQLLIEHEVAQAELRAKLYVDTYGVEGALDRIVNGAIVSTQTNYVHSSASLAQFVTRLLFGREVAYSGV